MTWYLDILAVALQLVLIWLAYRWGRHDGWMAFAARMQQEQLGTLLAARQEQSPSDYMLLMATFANAGLRYNTHLMEHQILMHVRSDRNPHSRNQMELMFDGDGKLQTLTVSEP